MYYTTYNLLCLGVSEINRDCFTTWSGTPWFYLVFLIRCTRGYVLDYLVKFGTPWFGLVLMGGRLDLLDLGEYLGIVLSFGWFGTSKWFGSPWFGTPW
jgi:hypothetical protein